MRFLKFCVEEEEGAHPSSEAKASSSLQWPAKDSEESFVDFLTSKAKLSHELQEIILYTIVLASEPQSTFRCSAYDGLVKVRDYLHSVSRFGLDRGAFILPMYGVGELSEAFCRVAAVHGAIYVLRQPISQVCKRALPSEEQEERVQEDPAGNETEPAISMTRSINVKLASGQVLSASKLIMGDNAFSSVESGITRKRVARGICIIDKPIVASTQTYGEETALLVIPPQDEDPMDCSLQSVTRILLYCNLW